MLIRATGLGAVPQVYSRLGLVTSGWGERTGKEGPACCRFVGRIDGVRFTVSLFLLASVAVCSAPSTVSMPRLFRVAGGMDFSWGTVVAGDLVEEPELEATDNRGCCDYASEDGKGRGTYEADVRCGIQLTLICGGAVTDSSSVSSSSTISMTSLDEPTGSTSFGVGGKASQISESVSEKREPTNKSHALYLDPI